jgi:Tol biopolymer transport system component
LNGNGLFRIPAEGGPETAILPSLPSGLWGGWALSGRKAIYATVPTGQDAAPAELRMLDLETGKARTVASLRFPPVQWDGALGASPDGRYALVTEVERQGSEIHLQPDR